MGTSSTSLPSSTGIGHTDLHWGGPGPASCLITDWVPDFPSLTLTGRYHAGLLNAAHSWTLRLQPLFYSCSDGSRISPGSLPHHPTFNQHQTPLILRGQPTQEVCPRGTLPRKQGLSCFNIRFVFTWSSVMLGMKISYYGKRRCSDTLKGLIPSL